MDSEIIDISELNMGNSGPSLKSSNFGGGLELLMNDNKKAGGRPSSDIDIDDLNNLENELNDLVEDEPSRNLFEGKSDMFSKGFSLNYDEKPSVRFDDASQTIGQATAEGSPENKTWDGFTKFNNVPINPDKPMSSQPQMSKEELLREKFKFLRKLEALEQK